MTYVTQLVATIFLCWMAIAFLCLFFSMTFGRMKFKEILELFAECKGRCKQCGCKDSYTTSEDEDYRRVRCVRCEWLRIEEYEEEKV